MIPLLHILGIARHPDYSKVDWYIYCETIALLYEAAGTWGDTIVLLLQRRLAIPQPPTCMFKFYSSSEERSIFLKPERTTLKVKSTACRRVRSLNSEFCCKQWASSWHSVERQVLPALTNINPGRVRRLHNPLSPVFPLCRRKVRVRNLLHPLLLYEETICVSKST